jgi:hypothetical protein
MPFTVTHIAAALPISWLSRWRLPFSALVFGTMVPDIAGYYPALLDYHTTHSPLGVITHCMPIGVLLYYVYQAFLKQPFFDLCPVAMTSRMRPWIDHGVKLSPIAICSVFLCVVLGAMTHVFWDSFTHFRGWGVSAYPTLNTVSFEMADRSIRWFTVIQHGSSLLLIPMLAGFVIWLRRLPRHDDPVDRARIPQGLVWFVLAMIVVGTAIHLQHLHAIHPKANWISVLAVSTKRSGAVTLFLFLVYAMGMNVLWWRERSRPPHIISANH